MKKFVLFILLCALTVFLFSCAPKSLDFDIGQAEKITIFSGSTGKSAEVTDGTDIKALTDNLNAITFIRDNSSREYDGFAYQLTWYGADGEVIEQIIVMKNNRIDYGGYFYNASDTAKKIDTDLIDSLLPTE